MTTSATPKDTQTDTQLTTASPAPASTATTTKPAAAKPKQRRGKPVKRRGAKVEEDEAESDDVALSQKQAADASDSDDSGFSVGGGAPGDDDEDEDDDESDAEGAADPKTPASASAEQTASSGEAKPTSKPVLDAGSASHPSWSDMPESGQNGAEDLPTLDFASLTPGTLAAVPNVATSSSKSPAGGRKPSATTSTDAPGLSKKAQAQARREAKSAEAKLKDPVAWEAKEKERLEREAIKKKEKNQRAKEKKLERKLAERQQQGTAPAAAPVASAEAATSAAPAPSNASAPHPPRNNQPRPPRPAVPSRPSRTAVQLGLVNDESLASTSRGPPSQANSRGAHPNGSRPPHLQPSADYLQAREAYSTRLANDPSYTPRVGKFWSHDDRLASPEVRPLVWRGRGGRGGAQGERGGFIGRGRGRGRAVASEGWTATGGWSKEDSERLKDEEEKKEQGPEQSAATEEKKEKSEDDEDDGWGRGEAKRNATSTPSSFASAPAWRHDGFDELQEDEARSANGRGRGGHRGGRGGRGGSSASHDTNGRPIPGAVNPRFANLPFHPQHRFPAAPSPAPVEVTSVPVDPVTSRPDEGEASLFDESNGKPAVGVRLPGSAAPVELSIKGAASVEQQSVPAAAAAAETLEARAEEQPRRPSLSTVLYSADPNTLPSDEQVPPPPPQPIPQPPAHPAYPHQQMPPQSFHQLPPHLQQGPPPPFPPQQIPRHASPAFYPHHPPQGYYSPEAFPSMPTPGATPPPPLYPLGPGAPPQAFFAPPRNSKIEIKAPGGGTVLSASGDAFSPRGQHAYAPPPPHHPQYSPISSRDGMGTPGSPQQMHRQQQRHQMQMQAMQQHYGYAPSPYEYEQQQQQQGGRGGAQGLDGSYMPMENGGVVYFVKSPNAGPYPPPPQHYYDPYAQQQAPLQGYGQQDPSMAGQGYGQVYQNWG